MKSIIRVILFYEYFGPIFFNFSKKITYFFRNHVDQINLNGSDEKPWYVGWANCDEDASEILREYYTSPSFLPVDAKSGSRDWIFIGTPGYGAPLHLDNVKYPSWQAQVGR